MKPKTGEILTGILAGLFFVAAAVAMLGTTVLAPNQVSGVPQLPGQFGFMCTGSGTSLACQIDSSYILNLGVPCPSAGGPCPSPFAPGVAPPPGPCPSTGLVIITAEPAAYFCAVAITPPGTAMNWMRVAGTNTW